MHVLGAAFLFVSRIDRLPVSLINVITSQTFGRLRRQTCSSRRHTALTETCRREYWRERHRSANH